MASAPCAIWKTPADLSEKAGDYEVYDSPRAGSKYWISGTGSPCQAAADHVVSFHRAPGSDPALALRCRDCTLVGGLGWCGRRD
jgi:hypothetical protein